MMCDEEIAEPNVSELIFGRVMSIGAAVDLLSRGIRMREIVPSRGELVLVVRG